MSNLKELALEEATLKALADAVGDRLKAIRVETQARLDVAERETGTRQIAATLPDGTPVATLSLTDPKPEAKVTDLAAFTAWVIANFPTEVERKFVTEIRGAFLEKVLAEITAAGVAEIADKETGVVYDVPGVEIKATRSRNHSLRFKPAGREAIAEAWQSGALALPGITGPAALDPAPEAES